MVEGLVVLSAVFLAAEIGVTTPATAPDAFETAAAPVPAGRLAELFRDPLVPDRVLHLVVRPSEAYARLRKTGKPDLWEAALDHRLGFRIGEAARRMGDGHVDAAEVERSFLEHQEQAAELLREVLPTERTVELDGRRPMEELEELAWLEIDRVLARRPARVT